MIRQFLLAAVLGLTYGTVDHFSWHDCGTDPNRPLKIYAASISPMPIVMPGTITISFNASLSRTVQGGMVDFDLRRHVPILGNVYVPCLFGIGSCDANFCSSLGYILKGRDELNRNVTNIFKNNNMDLACPIHPQKLVVAPASLVIPDIGTLTSVIAAGDYTIKATINDNHGVEVGCISFKVGLKQKSGGFLFG